MRTDVSTTQFRRTLCRTTALAGGVLLVAGPGVAQIVPTGPSFPGGQTDPTINAPAANAGGGLDLNIQTNANRSIVNWSTFNIGAKDSVNYSNGATLPADRVAILNRVIGPAGNNPSQSNIQGALTSPANISVYLINPTGIVFGNGANVNVGGLVASSLDLADADFLDGNNSFSFTGGGVAGVESLAGSTINSGEIVAFIGHFVNAAGGTIGGNPAGSAANPDNVAFVAGSDVSINVTPGSPLALTINQGTAVNTGVVVGGTVNGQNVYVGMATRSGVTDAVLNIGGMVTATTASATDRGIVLAAGTSAGGITVAGGAADTAGNAKINVAGSLVADDGGTPANNASVEIRALDNVSVSGSITADDQITIASTRGDVSAPGAINAGDDVSLAASASGTVTAANVTLGGDYSVTAGDFGGGTFAPMFIGTGNDFTITDTLGGISLGMLTAPGTLTVTALNGGGLNLNNGALTSTTEAVVLNAAGGINIVGGPATVSSAAGQTLTGPVALGADLTLVSSGGGAIAVNGMVNGANDLIVNTTGATSFGGAIGQVTALASLTTNAGGTTLLNGGAVTTSGNQSFGDAVTLGADTLLTSGGNVSLGGIVAGGTNDLVVNAAGSATFTGAVTAAALGVDANSVSFGATTNAVGTLAADIATGGIAFTNTPALTIGTVGGIIGAAAAAGNVAIASGGGIMLGQAVTATAGNVELAANGGALAGTGLVTGNEVALFGSAGIGAAGARVNTNAAVLAASSTAGGVFLSEANAVTLRMVGARGNDSAGDYDLTAGGTVTIEGIVTSGVGSGVSLQATAGDIALAATGVVNADSDILLDAAGAIDAAAGANLTATNIALRAQDFRGEIFSGAVLQEANNLAVTDTAGGLDLVSLSAANRLDIDVLGGGELIVIDSLAAGGVVDLAAAAITFDGAMVSGSSVIVGGPLALTGAGSTVSASGGGTILFGGTINGGQTLGATANGGTTFAGAVGTATALASLSVTGPAAINGGAVTTTGAQSYSGLVTLGADTVLIGGSGSFGAGVTGNDNDLTLNFGGTTVLNGSFTGIEDLATGGGGTTQLSGNITTSATQSYGEPVTLAGATVLTSSGNGAIAFGGTVNGAQALTVTTSGLTSFAGSVGGGTALASLTADGGGTTALNGGAVTTSGAQTYADAVALGANTVLTGGSGTFGNGIDGNGFDLTLNFGGTTIIDGGFTEIDDLATGGGGTTQLAGNITTTGAQSYGEAVTLDGNTQLTSSGNGAIAFGGTVDGAGTLGVTTSGLTSFAGIVGGTTQLTSLTTNGGGTTSLAANVTTSGAQLYADALALAGDVVLTGTDGTISGAITGNANQLDLVFSGLTIVGAGASGLDTLASLGGGTTQLNGTISTSGSQTYVDAVTLASAVTAISTANDAIDFQSTIDGANALTVTTAGLTRFNGAVGASTALASLLANGGGTTRINGGAVRTSGDQTYADAVELGATATFTGANGNFNAIDAIGPGIDLTLRFSGVTTLNAAPTDIDDLVSDNGGTTILNGAITTAGAQTYADAVTLGSTVTLTSSGNAAIDLRSSVNGARDLTVTTAGLTSFGGPVGGTIALTSLTTTGGGITAINGGGVTTTGSQTYADAVTIGAATILTSNGGGPIGFGATVDGPGALTVTTAGLTSFAGAVGGDTALGALTTNGGGTTTINGGSVRTSGDQNYLDAVTLGAPLTTLTATGGSGTFAALDGGGNELVMSFAGPIDINGDFTNLSDLSATGSGVEFNGRTLAVTGDAVLDGMGGDVDGGTVTAGNDIAIRADGAVDAVSLTAGDDIAIRAGGAVTVAALASGPRADNDGLDGAADNLAETAPGAGLPGNDIDIRGAGIGIGTASAAGAASDLRLTATSAALTIATGSSGARAELRTQAAAGLLAVTSALTSGTSGLAGGDIAVSAAGDAELASVTSQIGNVGITAAGSATGGSVTAMDGNVAISAGLLSGAAEFDSVSADSMLVDRGSVNISAGRLLVDSASANTSLNLFANSGQLTLGTGTAGTNAGVFKFGGTGEVQVTSLTAGTEPTSLGNIVIESVTNARLGDISSQTGSISVAAPGGEVTGIGAGGGANLTTLASGGDVSVFAGALARLGTVSSGADIQVRAGNTATPIDGSVEIGNATGTDVAIQAVGGSITAGTIAARDDIVLGAGTAIATGALTSSGSAEDGGSGVGDAGAGATFDLKSGGNILAAAGNGAINVTGSISGDVDVALAASMGVTTLGIIAGDDLVIRAGGEVATGDLTTGPDTTTQEGSGDPLVADNNLAGNDIDVAGTGIVVGTVRANGAGSDIRLRGPIGGAGPDLDLRSGGDIILDGLASARDVALDAGGIVRTADVRAHDDIAIRAVESVTAGTLTSGAAIAEDTDATGAADRLLGGTAIVGHDIDVRGGPDADGDGDGEGVTIAQAVAGDGAAAGAQSDLRVEATDGPLQLGTGLVGGQALLDKRGTAGDAQVAALTAGRASSAIGAVTIRSATNVRAGTIEARGGAIDIRAGVDTTGAGVRDGDVTGLAGSSNGLRPAFGRAVLSATPGTDLGAVSDRSVSVAAGGLVQLGAVVAGENVTVAAGSAGVASRDGAIDVSSVTARRGALSLTAYNDDPAKVAGIRLGADGSGPAAVTDTNAADSAVGTEIIIQTSSDAAEAGRLRHDIVVARTLTAGNGAGSEGMVTIGSAADAQLASGGFRIESLTGSIAVTAAGDVTGIAPATDAERGGTSSLAVTSASSGGDLDLSGAGDVRIGAANSRGGDLDVTATGSVTGLALAGGTAPAGANLIASRPPSGDGGRDVTVGAQRLARLGTIIATRDVTVTAGAAAIASADAGRNLSVRSTGTGGAGAPIAATRLWSANDILAPDFGQAQLTTEAAGRTIIVNAGRIAQLGQVRAGAGSTQTGTIQLAVNARAMTVSQAVAANGGLLLTAREGGLYLGTNLGVNEAMAIAGTAAGASSGGDVILLKEGAAATADADRADRNNELRVRSALAAGGGSPATGEIDITSARSVRLREVTASGSIDIAAGADLVGGAPVVLREGDVSGLAGNAAAASDAAFTRAVLDAGSDLDVRAGSLVQLGDISANRDIAVSAGIPSTQGAIDITGVTARTGSLGLSARATSAADPARDGDLILGNGAVGTTALVENANRGGTSGDIVIGVLQSGQNAGALDASGRSATIRGANNVRADFVGTRGGPIDLRAGVDAAGTGVRDGQVTGRAGTSNGLAPTFKRANLVADQTAFAPIPGEQSVNVEAGGLVQLGSVYAEENVRVVAGSAAVAARDGAIDVTSVTAERGSLTLTAFNDSSDPARPADVRLGASNAGGVPSTDMTTTFNSAAGLDALLQTSGTRGDVVIARTLTAGNNAALTSVRDVLLAPTPFEVRATRGDIVLGAARNVTGLPAGGTATGEALVPGSGLRAGNLTSGGDIAVDGAGNVRLRSLTSNGEDITVTAGGSVTGLAATDSGDAIGGAGRLFAGRDVTVTAGPLVRVSTIGAGNSATAPASASGGDVAVIADTVAVGSVDANRGATRAGNVTMIARQTGLHVGDSIADGATSLRTQTAGTLVTPRTGALGAAEATSRDTLDFDHGFANLSASAAGRTIAVTAGTQMPTSEPLGAAQLGTVSAGAGNGQLAAAQVTVTAERLTATSITAANGALALTAREGPLYLGTGSAGTTARLDKQGAADFAGNELRVRGSMTTGTAAGAVGDATLLSATDARLGTIEARGGAIDIRAGVDPAGAAVRDGDVTGLAVATPTDSVGLAASHDRAVLTAAAAIAVRAGGLVQAGAVAAGTNVLVEAGSAGIADRDGAIDLSSVVAASGSISLSAYHDDPSKVADIRLGSIAGAGGAATDGAAADSDAGSVATLVTTGGRGDVVVGRSLRAGGTVTIDGARDVRFAPAPFEMRSRGSDILVTAVRDVTGLVAGGEGVGAAGANGGELRAGTLTSGGDLAIESRGNVRLGAATSEGGSIAIGADGSVTGLGASASVTGAGRLFAARDVIVTAGPVARLSEIAAGTVDTGANASATGGDVAVTADRLAVERVEARRGSERAGNILLTARGSGLHVGSGRADGQLALSTGAAGALTTPTLGNLGGPDDATRDVLDAAHAAANLAAATSVTLIAGRDTAGAAPFGVAQLDVVTAGTGVTVTADRLTVADATAGGALALTTREGPLFLGTGLAGTSATLVKGGGASAFAGDEVRVRGSLVAGSDVMIRSATDARLGIVIASAGNLQVRAGADATGAAVRTGDVTGLAVASPIVAAGLSASHGRGRLTGSGSVDVEAGGLVQLGQVQAGQNVRVEAGSEGIAERDGAIDITSAAAAGGSLVLRAFNDAAARPADVRLGTTDASGAAQVDAAAADSSAGTRIELRTLGTRGDVVAGQSLVANGALGGGDVTLGSVADVRLASAADTAADADPDGVRSISDDVLITAARSVTGLAAGGTGTGQAPGELRAGNVTGGGDILIEGAGNVRLRNIASRAEDIVVNAGGSVTGLGNGDSIDVISGAGRLFAGRDVRVAAGDTARLTRIVAGRNADAGGTTVAVGRTNASANVALTASGTGLHAGTSEAGGTTTIRVRAAGALATPSAGDLASATAATLDTLATMHGAANLDAQAAGKTVSVLAGTDTPGAGALGAVQLGTVNAGAGTSAAAGNQIAVTADRLTISSATADNGAIVLAAREGPLFLGAGSAGTSATLTKSGAGEGTGNELRVRTGLTAGTAAGAIGNVGIVTATDARLNSITARDGSLDVTAARDVTGIRLAASATGRGGELGFGAANLGTGGGAGLDVSVTAGELAQLGTVAAGRTVNVASNSIELAGAMTAPEVNLTNRPARANGTRLGGTDTGNDNRAGLYVLREEELNRISAERVTIESGTQNIEIQNAALTANVGRANLRLLTTGRADVTGTLTAAGSPATRTIQIGGTRGAANPQDAATLAAVIAVTPASTGGGRLLAGTANLDLRAGFIGVGLSGFLSEIGLNPDGAPVSNDTINNRFIANPSSTLYVAGLGVPYQDKVYLTANTLTVSYTNYALFQNSVESVSGIAPTGVEIGGLNVQGALSLGSSGDTAPNGFALFGRINGQGGNQAALLGPAATPLTNVNRSNTRINGCLVGSGGGGCLVSQVGTPPLNAFDESAANILQTAENLEDRFDPIVGTNNEALFTGISSIDELVEPEIDCEADPSNAQCPAARPEPAAQQDTDTP